ncbi:MAG: hypothetical protein AB1500_03675 [Bacillota bacterium]
MNLDWEKNLSNRDRLIRTSIGFLLLGTVYTKTATGGLAAASVVVALSQFIEAASGY